jgi:hypothetical protein
MAKQDKKSTSHEVLDKQLIEVDPQSLAALVGNQKYIKVLPRDKVAGFIRGISDSDGDAEDTDVPTDVVVNTPGPGTEDIFIKYGTGYEKPNPAHEYGTLYNDTGLVSKVNLEFKVMIPLELADAIVGVEILSENEVIASI